MMSDKRIAVIAGVLVVVVAALLSMGVAALCVMAGLVEADRGGVAIVAIPTAFAGYVAAGLVRADIRGDK